jgi:hypothetical protein
VASQPQPPSRSHSLLQRALAVVILLVAAWVLLHFLVHLALAIASTVVVVVAIIAFVWALRVVF